jgi:hypothetical protein
MQRHDRNKCVLTEQTEEDENTEVGIKMKRRERKKYHFGDDGGRQLGQKIAMERKKKEKKTSVINRM